MAALNNPPPGRAEFSSRAVIKSFFLDLLRLVWWSFLCPTRLNDYLQTLHPDLTVSTGLSRQLWLARRSPAARRLLVMQLILWLGAGLLGGGLFVWTATSQGSPPSESVSLVAAVTAFSLALGLAVSAITGAGPGLAFGLSLAVAGSAAVGIASALSDSMAEETAIGLALVGALAIPLGLAGPVFDHWQRPGPALSRWSYWGRALLGLVLLAVALGIAFGLGDALTSYVTDEMVVVVAGGVAGIVAIMMAGGLEMLIDTRRLDTRRLGWLGLDSLILALAAGGAFALAANMTGNMAPVIAGGVALGIALGAVYGVTSRAGNGWSALLAAAGLTGLALFALSREDITSAALAAGGLLLLGLAFYLRLPLYLVEALWSLWLERRSQDQPGQTLTLLRRSPVYWDELIFFPLPRLEALLLRLLRLDRERGLIEGGLIAQAPRQAQAASRARLALAHSLIPAVPSPEQEAAVLAELVWPADRPVEEAPAIALETEPGPPNPYVGPRTFRPDEAHLFFGRELEAESLTALVASERLVLLYAQSGAGKSSLINTRLMAGLAAKGFEVLPVARVGGAPPDFAVSNLYLYNLMVSLDRAGRSPQRLAGLGLPHFLANLNVTDRGDYFYDDSDLSLPDEAGAEAEEGAWPRCLIIDQFEELFNTNIQAWPQRRAFFAGLNEAMRQDPHLWLVLSLREDYLAALDPFARLLPNRLQIRYYLQRMGPEAALQAIAKPAAVEGRTFAPGLAEQLVENLRRHDQFVEPGQLQIVCRDLWDKLPSTRTTIESGDLQEFGDVDQALIGFYESALQKALAMSSPPVPPKEGEISEVPPAGGIAGIGERTLRRWFSDKLITPARTRGLVYRAKQETGGLPNQAVDSLVNSYLIRADIRGDDIWYELAHDRLVEPVLEANRRWQAAYHNPVAEAYQAWQAAGRSPEQRLSGAQLREAERYAEQYPLEVTAEEKIFLADSRQQSRRAARTRTITIIVTLAVITALTGITLWALNQSNRATIALATAQAAATIVTDQSTLLFTQTTDPAVRLNSLARLIDNDGVDLARTLLSDLSSEDQEAVFNQPESEQLTKVKIWLTMVRVEAGPFTMGSDNGDSDAKPVHTVTLDSFYIDQYEVTNAQYAACVAAGGCETRPACTSSYEAPDKADHPVVCVSWYQAKAYCEWRDARLPTEAEWEKAARGPDGRTYPWGEEINCDLANYGGCVGDTTPVGNYPAGVSPYGAYDMAGNVWEWVQSEYRAYPYQANDGRENLDRTNVRRVLRGGSWDYYFGYSARASIRYDAAPRSQLDYIGLRCVGSAAE
jgi:formylglycine-generating enzyme required for sulfatase activity